MSPIAAFFLLIFSAVLAGSYIAIRRNRLPLRTAAFLCGVGSISSVIAFGFAQDLQILHAVLAGIIVGILFTAALVTMAAFFQANQPDAGEMEAYLKKDQP